MFEIISRIKKLYIPWVHMFANTLKEGKHTIVLKMSAEKIKRALEMPVSFFIQLFTIILLMVQ